MRAAVVLLAAALARPASCAGDGTFVGPRAIHQTEEPLGAVAAGHFDRDGRLDLAAVNGTDDVLVFLQPSDPREDWPVWKVSAGSGSWFLLARDLDRDGDDDLLAADPSTHAFSLRCQGDGRFEPWETLSRSPGSRWLTTGDWDGDGTLDLASADFAVRSVSIHLGRGDGTFRWIESHATTGSPHVVEAADHDGDRRADLVVKLSDVGLQVLRGRGDGTFEPLPVFDGLGKDGNIAVGDLDEDGRTDVALNCCGVGLSSGDGTFRRTSIFDHFGNVLIADLDHDGRKDLVRLLARDALAPDPLLLVHRNAGGGSFHPPDPYGEIGETQLHLARDLDGDGALDLVLSGTSPPSLILLRGLKGARLLEEGIRLDGLGGARAMAAADLDLDGWPDLFVPSPARPEVEVLLQPAGPGGPTQRRVVALPAIATAFAVGDLDGDGVPDAAGANRGAGTWLAAILAPDGSTRRTLQGPAGLLPSSVALGALGGEELLDLAVACPGADHLAVVLDPGRAAPGPALAIPSLEKVKDLAAADVDGDGRSDLAAISGEAAAVHHGEGRGVFTAPAIVAQDPGLNHTDLALGDVDGDGRADLVLLESTAQGLVLFPGEEGRRFQDARRVRLGGFPASVCLADLDGDGESEVTVTGSLERSASVLGLGGASGLERPGRWWIGFIPAGHLLQDLDRDGALDLVAFAGDRALVLPGRPATPPPGRFRRGDVDGDGSMQVNDPIALLGRLYLGAAPLACLDAADANDDGQADLSDAVAALTRLFLGGAPLPPPGEEGCGEDPTADGLGECADRC